MSRERIDILDKELLKKGMYTLLSRLRTYDHRGIADMTFSSSSQKRAALVLGIWDSKTSSQHVLYELLLTPYETLHVKSKGYFIEGGQSFNLNVLDEITGKIGLCISIIGTKNSPPLSDYALPRQRVMNTLSGITFQDLLEKCDN